MFKKTIPLLIAMSIALLLPSIDAHAQSNLQVLVCNPDIPSSISILQPLSDSVVNKPTVEIAGSVFRANQIEIYVNNAYSGTIPLSFDTTAFHAIVNVNPGTQTIRLVAIDICQAGNSEASAVLTYQENTTPSTGSTTETTVGGVKDTPQNQPQTKPSLIEQYVLPPILSIADGLDLTPRSDGTPNNSVPSTLRLALLITGIGLIAGAYNIGLAGTVFRPRFNIRTKLTPAKLTTLKLGIAGLGLIALIIMFGM